ncbi:MAG TPA: GNAT family N-acetyltransferase, partial [Chloroflexota bacterium]|nr:GNAT family N-acetyltransferase [Chloroflexota bacterium]
YRGKGIAMALKVRGVRYAREHGYREIRTNNDTANRPMLRINEAMGFVKQPAWIIFHKTFA